ncbi:MAG: 2,5-diamino-6-ribosylamino-4(3H)-pyrimidinone 5'-phosphate reductase [Methanosaeta sp. PtaU1.Bin028]|nr:MAG: 2,5-diamino-6-ribosylamino-4(3H)-pyrimidinone 5'-phosphate reductase [Methanosaeta sp. PtaU1.Bin028]
MTLITSMNRPFVLINGAMSADGKISSYLRRQVRISCQEDLARVDSLRARCDAIMVGVGTVLADDPSLTVKGSTLREGRARQGRPENPLRVVADSLARTPANARVLGPGCLLAVSGAAPAERVANLARHCQIAAFGQRKVDLPQLLDDLYLKGIQHLLVEGGATLNWSLLKEGLVDELQVFLGPMIIGGKDAPTLVDGDGFEDGFIRLELASMERIGDGALLIWRPS